MTGSMQPQIGSFTDFDGSLAAGDWMLMLVDGAGGDGGCFYTFSVEVAWELPAGPNPLVGAATATDNCNDDGLVITFEDESTQGLDGPCSEFNYEITRSWIATDPSGNADTCMQIITVEDSEAPEPVCNSISIMIDGRGEYTLSQEEIDAIAAGSSDNCDPNITYELDQTEFDCSDVDFELGENAGVEVELTVTDCSDNSDVCTALIEFLPATLDYDYACISDINLTLNDDCQALLIPEMVLSGDQFCIDLFAFDIVVMDNDPSNGPIVDGCGDFQYSITEINSADTPDPVSGFTGVFAPGNWAVASSVNNANQTTNISHDASELELSTTSLIFNTGSPYGVSAEYMFSAAGTASFDYNFNGVDAGFDDALILYDFEGNTVTTVQNTDDPAAGSSSVDVAPGYTLVVSLTDDGFQPVGGVGAVPSVLTISNFAFAYEDNSSIFDLGNFTTCWGTVHAEDKTSPEIADEVEAPAPLYCDAIDGININLLTFNISRCWIQSGADGTTLNGSMNPGLRARLLAGGGIPNFTDGCSDVEICVNDVVADNGDCSDVTITRTFTATDGITCDAESGEENAPAVYSYDIIFTRPTIDDVDAVNPTAIFECDESFPTLAPNQFGDENPAPEVTDYPFFDDGSGPTYLTESFCNIGATFQDGPRIETCEQTYKFVRTFTVIDWCNPGQIETFTQLVKVGDFDAPVIAAPTQDLDFDGVADDGPLFFSTSNPDCSANFLIPAGSATDNCDPNPSVIALIYPNGDTNGAAVGPFAVGGGAFSIPVGDHVLRYIARDACDNADTLDVDITIGDKTAPVAICEDGLDISLGGAGVAELCGEDIDQASYDECSDITRYIAFVGDNNLPVPGTGGWQECITLTCDMIGTVRVGLRVEDAEGNWNTCWLDVLVEDKLAPLCVAPGPVTTTCDDEDIATLAQDLEDAMAADPVGTAAQLDAIFGAANGLDNCPTITIDQTVIDTRNSCGVGSIIRNFLVTDGQGFTSTGTCSQLITVLGVHDYTIVFPADAGSEECVEPDYNGVTFDERGCDLITTTVEIDTFEATADECYKLRLTYEVLNWCEYNTEEDPYMVPRDADGDDILEERTWLHVLPRDVSTLNDDIAYLDRDGNRFNGFISPLDEHDPNGQVFGSSTEPYGTDEARGGFLYIQFIKVYDDVAPEVTVVTPEPFEDEDGDCAEPVELGFTVSDECTNAADYTATAELDPFFQDVDADGVLTLADFVPTGSPALQPNVVNNGDGTFTITFNVDLPLGVHAVRIRATDGCGNAEIALIVFEVIDTKAPTPVCINGLTATLMPDGDGGGMAAIWAAEYIASEAEDCNGPVKYAIYRSSTAAAADFPGPMVGDTGLFLTCDDEGLLAVRVYAIDAVGNADYCETTLLVQAFQEGVCSNDGGGNILGNITTPADNPVANVEVSISGDMDDMVVTDVTGNYAFTGLTIGDDYTVAPALEADVDVASAVTTYDILLINRHILAIAELASPYQHVVADVTMDGDINVLDVVHIRMVIMGQRTTYPNAPSWRFADADYSFGGNAADWASEDFDEVNNQNNLPGDILGADFLALEMGNVSEGVLVGEARSTAALNTTNLDLLAGNTYEVAFTAADLYGFQGTLELGAGVELADIDYGQLSASNVNLDRIAEGLMAISYDEVAGTTEEVLFTLELRATADAQLSDVVNMTSRVATAEAYPVSGGVANLGIDFGQGVDAGAEFVLEQNSPNPLRTTTQIAFNLPEAGTAKLIVQDAIGRTILVRDVDGVVGYNQLSLVAADLNGAKGVLSYTLTIGDRTATRRMIVD